MAERQRQCDLRLILGVIGTLSRWQGIGPGEQVAIIGSMTQGVRATAGFAIGALMFGLVFGSASFAIGMPPHQSMLMSATAFAGAAQFAALPFWTHPLPWLAMGLSVALVSTRNILMGLSLAAAIAGLHGAALQLTDAKPGLRVEVVFGT